MEKINFTNKEHPPINGTNLNRIQENVENAISNVSNYSTEEIVIGTWMDKPLYRKVVQYNGLAANTTTTIATIPKAETLLIKGAYLIANGDDKLVYPLNMVGYNGNTTDKVYVYSVNDEIRAFTNGGWNGSVWQLNVIVEYTKTTD